jgi:D-tagatose-1,6-bisphosphate aldolase subunit GatZ/KbaZ
MAVLEQAVYDSGRWQKWLQPDEYPDHLPAQPTVGRGKDGEMDSQSQQIWAALSPQRRSWLTQTGARYVWTAPPVVAARRSLYHNLELIIPDPHAVVVERIAQCMEKYVVAFNLFDSLTLLEGD